MNETQKRTFSYLTEPGHSAREDALTELQSQGFFNHATETDSTKHLLTFIRDARENEEFCDQGIDRFADAVLQGQGDTQIVGPRTDSVWVNFHLDVTHGVGDLNAGIGNHRTRTAFDEIVGSLATMLGMAETPDWKVERCSVDDWDVNA